MSKSKKISQLSSEFPRSAKDIGVLGKKDWIIKEILNQISYLHEIKASLSEEEEKKSKHHIHYAILSLENLMKFVDKAKEINENDCVNFLIFISNTVSTIMCNTVFVDTK